MEEHVDPPPTYKEMEAILLSLSSQTTTTTQTTTQTTSKSSISLSTSASVSDSVSVGVSAKEKERMREKILQKMTVSGGLSMGEGEGEGEGTGSPIREPTPWCRKVLHYYLSQCAFFHPEGEAGRRMCIRVLNTWMQKCVPGSEAADEHTADVHKENAPSL